MLRCYIRIGFQVIELNIYIKDSDQQFKHSHDFRLMKIHLYLKRIICNTQVSKHVTIPKIILRKKGKEKVTLE